MPLVATRGAASVQGFGEFAQSAAPTYIEDVFSTYLYTGNGSTQTITNGIDLSTKGGLTWIKWRSGVLGSSDNALFDTSRGVNNMLYSNSTAAQMNTGTGSNASLSAFNSNGFSLGADALYGRVNYANALFASWTFRKQAKFFDVVTYTGTGSSRTVAHSLGSVPGCIIVKRTDVLDNWQVYHRSLSFSGGTAQQSRIVLNTTAVVAEATLGYWDGTAPTSTVFSLGGDNSVNASGGTYVAYLFAHDAGGFGLTGTDNVISCGSYTGLSTGQTVTLGYEPQWVLVKKTNATSNWYLLDNMRGMTTYNSTGKKELYPNTSGAEVASANTAVSPTATGFIVGGGGMSDNGDTYIYIAIRRGPMKTPTSGTSVFSPVARTGTSTNTSIVSGIITDAAFIEARSPGGTFAALVGDRLRNTPYFDSGTTAAETSSTAAYTGWDLMDGIKAGPSTGTGSASYINSSSVTYANWFFRRAPGTFDEVCYTGNGVSGSTQNHNLNVVPELMVVKQRNSVGDWYVYTSTTGATQYLRFNLTNAAQTASTVWANTGPTSSVFTVGTSPTNANNSTYVAYLWATNPGVTKVGSFTGNGSTQTINCGFAAGARFVLIKSTSASGNWYVFDTARGMTTSTDPWLALNSTAAESATTGACTTTSVGFALDESNLTGINTNAVSYIFLAYA